MSASRVGRSRIWLATLASVAALSFVGFFIGVRTSRVPNSGNWTYEAGTEENTARPARSNAKLAVWPWSADTAAWTPRVDDRGTPVTPAQTGAKAAALAQRRERRMFEGAPPMVPHPIGQRSALECWVCHESGASIGDAVAPPAGHGYLTMCTQCHVPLASMLPTDEKFGPTLADSAFAGLGPPEPAKRWAAESPPQMPHRTFMRERCIACHGPAGRQGLQTSHPERGHCLQCHTLDAALEGLP